MYYLQQQFPAAAEIFIDDILKDTAPAISVITEIELLCWKTPTDEDTKVLHNFINDAFVLELESEIKTKTAAIRKLHSVKLPDAVIAATALSYDLVLLSRNTKDFKNIDGLQLINPHER